MTRRITYTEIDRHVGQRLRYFRSLQNVPQQTLADRLGVTLQQIQRYEGGENRLSAGMLWDCANVLNVPLTEFFPAMGNGPAPPVLTPANARLLEFFGSFEDREILTILRTLELVQRKN